MIGEPISEQSLSPTIILYEPFSINKIIKLCALYMVPHQVLSHDNKREDDKEGGHCTSVESVYEAVYCVLFGHSREDLLSYVLDKVKVVHFCCLMSV